MFFSENSRDQLGISHLVRVEGIRFYLYGPYCSLLVLTKVSKGGLKYNIVNILGRPLTDLAHNITTSFTRPQSSDHVCHYLRSSDHVDYQVQYDNRSKNVK